MALHKNFPDSPYAILDPDIRWFPADETLRETSMDKLMPPLVSQLRKKKGRGMLFLLLKPGVPVDICYELTKF